MALNKIIYPLDLTGELASNLISSEQHTIGVDRQRAFALNYGPFFVDSVLIVDAKDNRRLVRGVDFECIYIIPELIKVSGGKDVAGVILITNPDVSTQISVSYQIVGGHYCSNVYVINKAIEDVIADTRIVNWENILKKPSTFQAAPHLHDIGDTYGLEYIVSILSRINQTIVAGNSEVTNDLLKNIESVKTELTAIHNAYVARRDNPHVVTAEQVNCYDKEAITEKLAEVAKRFEALEPRLSAILTKIATNINAIANLANTVNAQGNRIGDVEHVQALINTLLSDCTDELATINTRLTGIDNKIKALESNDGNLQASINTNTNNIYDLGNANKTLELGLHTANGNINLLNNEVAVLKRTDANLLDLHNAQQNQIDSLSARETASTNSISKVSQQVTAQTKTISALASGQRHELNRGIINLGGGVVMLTTKQPSSRNYWDYPIRLSSVITAWLTQDGAGFPITYENECRIWSVTNTRVNWKLLWQGDNRGEWRGGWSWVTVIGVRA